jgi:tRNA-uridine 2-sulfurtransferase
MSRELIEEYLADQSHRGPAPDGAFSGSAGGAPCGDLIRISVLIDDGAIGAVSFDAEGCAATRAAGAAVAEMVEERTVLDAALVGPNVLEAELGGLSQTHRHAAELAADALGRALAAAASSGDRLAGDAGARVLVALSGGVDSAVAALLERERGAEVVAVTLKLWADRRTDGERSCCSPESVVRARDLAHSLGIPHLTLDLEERFRATVVEDFLAGYAAGRTPNPCVRCNGELRIDAMIELADRIGASHLVTGHYARIADDGEGPLLARPADDRKDQTHMLSALRPASLGRLRFPLEGLAKPEVRRIAERAALAVAKRPESQDLCFLAGQGKREFLRRHAGLADRPGEIVDAAGTVIGRHPGHHNFTVGQRRGLGVGGSSRRYVLGTDTKSNRVLVGEREQLAQRSVRLREARLLRDAGRIDGVRLRHHSPALRCRAHDDGDGELTIALAEPGYGVAPGQTASLLDGELVIGHGTIANTNAPTAVV